MKKQITTLEAYRYLLENPENNRVYIAKQGWNFLFIDRNGTFLYSTASGQNTSAANFSLDYYAPLYIEVEDEPMESNWDLAKQICKNTDIDFQIEATLAAVDTKLEPLLERIKMLEEMKR